MELAPGGRYAAGTGSVAMQTKRYPQFSLSQRTGHTASGIRDRMAVLNRDSPNAVTRAISAPSSKVVDIPQPRQPWNWRRAGDMPAMQTKRYPQFSLCPTYRSWCRPGAQIECQQAGMGRRVGMVGLRPEQQALPRVCDAGRTAARRPESRFRGGVVERGYRTLPLRIWTPPRLQPLGLYVLAE